MNWIVTHIKIGDSVSTISPSESRMMEAIATRTGSRMMVADSGSSEERP